MPKGFTLTKQVKRVLSGRFNFQLTDSKMLETCHNQVTAQATGVPLVASCFEMVGR
jgi:hypothetical protein